MWCASERVCCISVRTRVYVCVVCASLNVCVHAYILTCVSVCTHMCICAHMLSVLAEVQQLMGCFVYSHRGLQQSPYSDLLDSCHWTDAANTFAKDCCTILGLAMESPLSIRYFHTLTILVFLYINNIFNSISIHRQYL